jgi:acetylornithine deacetylase/succinyl-diaminopimelate desuccinylase-like protein
LTDVPSGAGHGSDGSTLRAAGIPVVLLGPGDIGLAHSEAEYLELDALDRAVEVYLDLMRTPLGVRS